MSWRMELVGAWIVLAACAPSPRVHTGSAPAGPWRVAVIPLANYTESVEAADRAGAVVNVELATRQNVQLIDPGQVEDVLSHRPWLLTDRIPPDVVRDLSVQLGADALLVGSVLTYGYRQDEGSMVPQASLSLRLIRASNGDVIWSAVHSRDGTDGEWFFGMGRINNLEQLTIHVVREIFERFPVVTQESVSMVTKGEES